MTLMTAIWFISLVGMLLMASANLLRKGAVGPKSFNISADALTEHDGHRATAISWRQVRSIDKTRGHIFVRISRWKYVQLSARDFQNEYQFAQCYADLVRLSTRTHNKPFNPIAAKTRLRVSGTLGRKMRIETSRLWLRPYTEDDIEDAIGVLGDAETMSFYPRSYSPEEVANIVRASMATYQSHGFGRFAVIAREAGCYIGECGITLQDIEGVKEHEVGYRFAKRHWGQGYAREAAAAVVRYGFETLGLSRLCSYMASGHHQSRRVAEKLGMRLEKQYHNERNRGYLTCVYSIHRELPRATL
jgi:RimJ/RimL family protein N-acetyltransferase